ncbi:hypothetical protein HOA93_06155 [bacterium]|nr:hypothetical protein [bacterium]
MSVQKCQSSSTHKTCCNLFTHPFHNNCFSLNFPHSSFTKYLNFHLVNSSISTFQSIKTFSLK